MSRKYLFLPHCMKNSKQCSAKSSKYGYICTECGNCQIAEIVKKAKELDYDVYIVPGGSLIKKIYKRDKINKDDLIFGVACNGEVREFYETLDRKGIDSSNVFSKELDKDGCIDTKVNLKELLEKMEQVLSAEKKQQ